MNGSLCIPHPCDASDAAGDMVWLLNEKQKFLPLSVMREMPQIWIPLQSNSRLT